MEVTFILILKINFIHMKRRNFLHTSILGAMVLPNFFVKEANIENIVSGNFLKEPSRSISIKDQYDVIVCGGGPAGVAAAILAARTGAKTALIEWKGCLGGVMTTGILPWILDHSNKRGFMDELKQELARSGGVGTASIASHNYSFDAENMKLVLEQLCVNENIDLQLHTQVVAVVKKKNRITHIVTESKSGREAWCAKIFIDTTGDGDLAAKAGCGFDMGNEEGTSQPATLLGLINGVNLEEIKDYVRWKNDTGQASKKRLLNLIQQTGMDLSYKSPGIYPIYDDLFFIMANHVYGVNCNDSKKITQATISARKELNQVIQALKSHGGVWKNIRLLATGEQIGIREGRRIHGLYTVTKDDVMNGQKQPDGICQVTFGFDVHSLIDPRKQNTEGKRQGNPGAKAKPYDIPARSLIAKDVNGLMMAGRNISGDFLAHSSYRVTGNAIAMGEAAGKIAAMAAVNGILPQDIVKQKYGM